MHDGREADDSMADLEALTGKNFNISRALIAVHKARNQELKSKCNHAWILRGKSSVDFKKKRKNYSSTQWNALIDM